MEWNIDIDELEHGKFQVETIEGAVREGPITQVNWRQKNVLGRVVKEPLSIEMNGEAADFISWDNVAKIRRIGK